MTFTLSASGSGNMTAYRELAQAIQTAFQAFRKAGGTCSGSFYGGVGADTVNIDLSKDA